MAKRRKSKKKNAQISDQALMGLVVVAVAISLAGTFVMLSQSTTYTGGVIGEAKVNVSAVVAISLPVNVVDFGTLFQGATDNTTDSSPPPLIVQNDGGVDVNVSASGTPLFSGSGGGDNTASYQFKARENPSEPGSFNTGASVTSFVNVSTTPITIFITDLEFAASSDTSLVDLLINIPFDESLGEKNSTLTFTAIQA